MSHLALRFTGLIVVLLFLFGPQQDPFKISPKESLEPPSLHHCAGTDRLGRDLLARTSLATRNTLLTVFAAEAVGACLAIGVASCVAGWFRSNPAKIADNLTFSLRMLPPILLALLIAVSMRGTWLAMIGALAFLTFVYAVPVFAEEISTAKSMPQLRGAEILGASWSWQLRYYIVPMISPRLVKYMLLDSVALVAYESLFGFFGLTDPANPSLGGLLADSRLYLFDDTWLFYTPVAVVMILMAIAWHGSSSFA